MTLAWPWGLAALLAIPALLLARWLLRRRRRRAAIRVSSIAIVRAAAGRPSWTRRIPAALLLIAIGVLAVAAARPQAALALASDDTTIMLTIDSSGSMCSTDVEPNRLAVAEQSASDFVRSQGAGAKIGLVTFSGAAGLLVPPTDDKDALIAALQALTTNRGTAIGQAILTSLDAIAENDPAVAGTGVDVQRPEGADYAADVIVLLTDGANTQGVDPLTAAQAAADRGVRIYTISFGTTNPADVICQPSQMGGFDGPGFGGFGRPGPGGGFGGPGPNALVADEGTLERIAETTGGEHYTAQDAAQLQEALADLPKHLTTATRQVDLAAWFAAGGGMLVVAAVALSLWWNRVRTRTLAP